MPKIFRIILLFLFLFILGFLTFLNVDEINKGNLQADKLLWLLLFIISYSLVVTFYFFKKAKTSEHSHHWKLFRLILIFLCFLLALFLFLK